MNLCTLFFLLNNDDSEENEKDPSKNLIVYRSLAVQKLKYKYHNVVLRFWSARIFRCCKDGESRTFV